MVELLDDAATLLLPADDAEILNALTGLKVSRLLGGFRGGVRADLPALARILGHLCRAFESQAERHVEIEINPLFVCESGVWAVDALVQTMNPT